AKTQRARAETEAGKHVHPFEESEQIARLLKAGSQEGPVAHLLVLLLLDAGLRLGEVLGLRWGKIIWGADESDLSRSLLIDEARPRGGEAGPPKSGRARRVGLSRRLKRTLGAVYRDRFEPGPDALVLEGVEPGNFRNREWRRILKRGELGHRRLKDLRGTFASQLLTAGVQLGYVSMQLGHADGAVTAQHYAPWVGGFGNREPMRLLPGEVPADLLARLPQKSQQSPTTPDMPDDAVTQNQWYYGALLVGAAGFEPATFSSQNRGHAQRG
ncbi:MAG: tyrosine-type recombinase/integrase, partial [Gemmatimonadota bacterium]